jgi:hypothetical protein
MVNDRKHLYKHRLSQRDLSSIDYVFIRTYYWNDSTLLKALRNKVSFIHSLVAFVQLTLPTPVSHQCLDNFVYAVVEDDMLVSFDRQCTNLRMEPSNATGLDYLDVVDTC